MSYYAKHRHITSKRPVLRAVAASTALVLLVLAGTVFLTYRHLEGNITVSDGFEQIVEDRPEEVEVEGPKQPLNILLLGSDTREGQTEVLGQTPGLGLSDTTILLHLSADRERAYGVSIPRDLIVSRPECEGPDGKKIPGAAVSQWNEAYSLGGEACTIAQFEKMSKLRVNHFVVIDFNGFKDMVDALGGVPVCVPEEVDDPIGKIYLPAGSYEVTGDQALDYVRVRHDISDNGDIGRMKRQQAFLAAMVNKAVSAGTLFNPPRLVKFLNAGTKSLTTDPGLAQLTDLFTLAEEVRDIGLNQVQFLTVPFTAYEPDPNRLALAPNAEMLWNQLRNDVPLSKELTSEATKASEGKPGSGKPKPEDAEEAQQNGLCA